MNRRRPTRVQALTGIGVDRMGDLAGKAAQNESNERPLRLENLDTDIAPHQSVLEVTAQATATKEDNSYLPFIGQIGLRDVAASHVSRLTGGTVKYTGDKNCVITAGGLSGVLNALLATVEPGDGVVMTDPTYSGLINRVKLAGGVPILVPLDFQPGDFWKFNSKNLRDCIKDASANMKVTTMLLNSPSLPSGMYLDQDDWQQVAEVCIGHDLLLIYDTAFERLLFDGRPVVHPASLPNMAERTITVGSASKELRMIGWRVGWIVGPEWVMSDLALVGMANVVVPVGIAQNAAKVALEMSEEDLPTFVNELQARRDLLMQELKGLPLGVPAGGWAFIVKVDSFGLTGKQASEALIEQGVYVTSMDGWGDKHGSQFFRIVFANEPCDRLRGIGKKVRRALGIEP